MRAKFDAKDATLFVVIVVGLLFTSLGIEGTFTFVSCGSGPIVTCINVYSLDVLAILGGAAAMLTGAFLLVRDLLRSLK